MLYSVTEPDGSPEGGYMRLRNIPRAEAVIADSALVVHNPKGKLAEAFWKYESRSHRSGDGQGSVFDTACGDAPGN